MAGSRKDRKLDALLPLLFLRLDGFMTTCCTVNFFLLMTVTFKYSLQVEDVLALGICVEQTKLQTVTSTQECLSFVSRVEFLQPCLDRAFGQRYSALCSPSCLQHLDSIR